MPVRDGKHYAYEKGTNKPTKAAKREMKKDKAKSKKHPKRPGRKK